MRNSREIKDLLHVITEKTKDLQQGIMNQENKIQEPRGIMGSVEGIEQSTQ